MGVDIYVPDSWGSLTRSLGYRSVSATCLTKYRGAAYMEWLNL